MGLAANQLGIDKAVCVINTSKCRLTLVNPVIVDFSDARAKLTEGCLSFPKRELEVYRHVYVELMADNLDGFYQFGIPLNKDPKDCTNIVKDFFTACVVQHEVAHLCGLVINDFVNHDCLTPDKWPQYQ